MKNELDFLLDAFQEVAIREIKKLAKKLDCNEVVLNFSEGNTIYTSLSFSKDENGEIEDICVHYQYLDDDGLYFTEEVGLDRCSLSVLKKIFDELYEIA